MHGPFVSVELSGRHGVGREMKLDPDDFSWVMFLTPWWVVLPGNGRLHVTTGRKLDIVTGQSSSGVQHVGLARLIVGATDRSGLVWFANGDTLDLRRKNLELISRKAFFARIWAPRKLAA